MAGKRKKTTTVVEEIPPELETPEEQSGPTDIDFALEEVQNKEKLEEVIEQFPDAGIVAKLYDDSGAFCYRFADPRNIDEEDIRKRCGPGNYNVRIYLNGKYRQSIKLPIRQLLVNNDQSKPGDGSISSDRHSEFLEKLLLAFISKEASTAQPVATPSLADLTSALSNLDNLRGKQESALDMVLKGIELAKDLNGDTDWKTDLIRMGRETLPKIVEGVTGIMGGQKQQIQNTPIASTEATLPAAEAIKAGIGYLKKKCISGVDPGLIIDWVINNSEEYEGFIKVILNMDFAEFAKYDIEIGSEPFIGWFRAVYDGCRSAFTESNSVDDDSTRPVGDSNNLGSNGQPRKDSESKPKG